MVEEIKYNSKDKIKNNNRKYVLFLGIYSIGLTAGALIMMSIYFLNTQRYIEAIICILFTLLFIPTKKKIERIFN